MSEQKMRIPMLDLTAEYHEHKDEFDDAIHRVLESGKFIMGEEVERFEASCEEYLGVKHAIGVANGSDALYLALQGLGMGPGDQVITTPFTFFATAGSIVRCGATPVFVDIDPRTYNIDSQCIREYLDHNDHTRVKAILPVHLYGQCADMGAIMEIAREYHLLVVEDACQSFGATYRGTQSGSIGNAGCFSFFPTKNLGCFGDGGMVVTNDDALAERVRMLRVHGARRKYYHELLGINSRLDALQAAILSVKLKYLPQALERRHVIADAYDAALADIPGVVLPIRSPDSVHTFHQYTIAIPGNRDAVQNSLREQGIASVVYYPTPLNNQPALVGVAETPSECGIAEEASGNVLSLAQVAMDGLFDIVRGVVEQGSGLY
jgi:dTDP-4-amino-4,6-dideoxygalactose transaminase